MTSESQRAKPTDITLNREQGHLLIAWADGHTSAYPLPALREACPCAACRGGHEFMGQEHDPDLLDLQPARAYDVRDLQVVGNYALQFLWSDNHSSGIYTWDYLRRICPCPECTQARKAGS